MKVLIVSNMFPNNKNPFYGIFVKRFCNELDKCDIKYEKSVIYKSRNIVFKILRYLFFYIHTFLLCLLKKYDVIYIHYASHSSLPVLLAAKFKKLVIYTNVHGSDVVPENKKQEKMQKYTRRILEISQKIITPSNYFKEYVANKYNIKNEKIIVYPSGGVDTNVFYKVDADLKNRFKEKLGIPKDKIVIGYISRISSGKGWDTFIEAVKLINDSKIDFLMVGSGPNEIELNKMISEQHNNIMRFPMMNQEQLIKMYNCIDYLVFPTKREGESLGLVAIEAMACGTPVIASDFAAPKYYVKNNVNGFKFKVNDPYELSRVIYQITKISKKDYEVLSNNAVKTAQSFSVQNNSNIIKEIFYG